MGIDRPRIVGGRGYKYFIKGDKNLEGIIDENINANGGFIH